MKLVDVNPEEIPNFREGRRGRVSFPILKMFLESGKYVAMLDRTGIDRTLNSLQAGLSGYVKAHNLPIKIMTRNGQIYLLRLDINEDGSPNEEWGKTEEAPPAQPFSLDAVREKSAALGVASEL